MSRIALRTASAVCLTAAVAVLAWGQNPPGTGSNVTPVRAKSLLGAQVALQGGTAAGTVEDIVLSNEGVVDYLIVSQGGKLVTVPWDAAKFSFQKDNTAVINLNVTPEQYKAIPTYGTQQYPEFYNPAYQTQVYKYYNLTPGKWRRLERRQ